MKATSDYESQKARAHNPDARIRAELAADPGTRPEILFFLSEDPSPDVRRALAQNSATPSHVYGRLANDSSEEVRTALAEKVADLFPDLGSEQLSQLNRRVAETIETLARDQLTRVRTILSEALKDRLDAPAAVIQRLARDAEIAVAGPVLRCSPLLADEDLVNIIGASHAPGALAAIADRRGVSARVCDAIADTRDVEAVGRLLANASAQIREETLDELIEAARDVEPWHRPLVARPNLPSSAVSRIAAFVADSLLDALRAREDLAPDAFADVAEEIKRRIGAPPTASVAELQQDTGYNGVLDAARAEALHKAGKLTEDEVSDALLSGAREFVVAALGLRANLTRSVVESVVASRSAPALVALTWKAELSPEFAAQVQLHLAKLPPATVLVPRGASYPLKPEDMAWQIEFFSTLAPAA